MSDPCTLQMESTLSSRRMSNAVRGPRLEAAVVVLRLAALAIETIAPELAAVVRMVSSASSHEALVSHFTWYDY